MNDAVIVATLLGALSPGVVSPGPSFLMVAQTAVARSRRVAFAAALGMGVAAALLALMAVLGLHMVLSSSTWMLSTLQGLGGLYLLYLALRIWQHANIPLVIDSETVKSPAGGRQAFVLALATMLSNPKAAVQYGVVFAALLPSQLSPSLSTLVVFTVFLLETTWYTIVAQVLSSSRPRSAYLAYKPLIDRTAAIVMTSLGIRLLVNAAASANGSFALW